MKPWLLIDTETSGTDPSVDRLIEVGAVLFDPQLGIPVRAESMLIAGDSNAAESVNRIPAAALRGTWCVDESVALARVHELASSASYLLAHNADFDRQWLDGSLPPEAHWIDTCEQAEWPRASSSKSLVALALAHDVGVVRAHRAIEDCLLLAALLTRTHEIEGGLEAWLSRALEPRIEYAADVLFGDERPRDAGFHWNREASEWRCSVRESMAHGFEVMCDFPVARADEPMRELVALTHYNEREKTKAAGFRWDGERKLWVRAVRSSLVGQVRDSLDFKTREVA